MDRCDKQAIELIEDKLRLEAKKFVKRATSQKTGAERIGSVVMNLTGISLQKQDGVTTALAEVKKRLTLERKAARYNFPAYNLNRHISLKQAYNRLLELQADSDLACVALGARKIVK